ncbi:MAG TPA: hypothetical protein DHV29_04685 [Bacteroidales bacterium]|nr:hypothetical protein [Bacteroidales bacterium]
MHRTAIYKLKPGTSTSYYYQSGTDLLPNRICITQDAFAVIRQTGNHLHKPVGQIKATFTKKESAVYKLNYPFNVHTSIYQYPDCPLFIGYGSIGISNNSGKISETGDLVILYCSTSAWDEIELHFFPGMLKKLPEAFEYLYKIKRCNP